MPSPPLLVYDRPPDLATAYREHAQFVWRSAKRLGAPVSSLEDVTQEVFLTAHRRWSEFRGEARFQTWLFAVTVRVVLSYRRTLSRHARRLEALARSKLDESTPDLFQRSDASAILQRLLDGLDDERRMIIVAIELEGMTAQEVADCFAIKVNTVYSRLRATRKHLERSLADPPAQPLLGGAR